MQKYKIPFFILLGCLSLIIIIFLYQFIRLLTAKIEVDLVDNLEVEFNSKVKVSDFIKSINGTILDDYQIDTTKLGNKEIEFKFKNDDNIKVKYQYNINIVDKTKPLIWLDDIYKVAVNSDIKLEEKILCGDNYDSKPNCFIEGDYDLNTIGDYDLVFKALDNSGNEAIQPFTLKVYEPTSEEKGEKENYPFSQAISQYKTANNKIGIDVSKWQGDIDFAKLKENGVEFVMIRVGGTRGKNGKYFVDEKFKQNIKNANKENIPVGVYFYSYADSSKKAKEEAKWVLNQIKNYQVDLPIAFDWEEWSNFNEYNLSFFGLTSMAEEFLKVIEANGYKGMLYSSKNYLEKIWLDSKYDIWLAHYTLKTDYTKDFKMWQICDNGQVTGIEGFVDIDVLY